MSAKQNPYTPTVLLTGHNGFLGSYLKLGLEEAGYRIVGLSRRAGDIICDLATKLPDLSEDAFDLVVHAAGKAHTVPRNDDDVQSLFQVNFDGSVHLLRALELAKTVPAAFVLISTVAVYGCESGYNISEETALLGKTAYARSKIQAEEVVQVWCQKHGIRCVILRLPLIVGNSAPGNLGKLVGAIRRGHYIRIGAGKARRSMVLADDVARIIPKAAQVGGIYNLTDGVHPSVGELSEAIAQQVGRRLWFHLPFGLARMVARLGDGTNFVLGQRFPFDSMTLAKMTSSLIFSDQRARQQLGWTPKPVLSFFSENSFICKNQLSRASYEPTAKTGFTH